MRRIPISQFASIISFTLSMVKCPCFRPAFPINRFITVGKPLYKAVGLLRRKIFGKFNDPVVIQSICRMLFSVWRCELEPGSHTTQLIAFSLQLRLQIFPVIQVFSIIIHVTQNSNDIECRKPPFVIRACTCRLRSHKCKPAFQKPSMLLLCLVKQGFALREKKAAAHISL